MKKLIFSLLAIVTIFFMGCSKEESNQEPQLDDRLVGTEWITEDTVYELFYGGVCYNVFEFTSTTTFENYTTQNGRVVDSDGEFSYTLEYPILTLHSMNSDGDDYIFEFKDSRTIVRSGANEYMSYMKYIKQ